MAVPWKEAATLVRFPSQRAVDRDRVIVADGTLEHVTRALLGVRPSERPAHGIYFPDRTVPPFSYASFQFSELLLFYRERPIG